MISPLEPPSEASPFKLKIRKSGSGWRVDWVRRSDGVLFHRLIFAPPWDWVMFNLTLMWDWEHKRWSWQAPWQS